MSARVGTPNTESWSTEPPSSQPKVEVFDLDTPVLDTLPPPPSASATEFHYNGLPGSPRLVATTSTPMEYESQGFFRWRDYNKLLRAIADHPAREKWHPGSGLSNDILTHLDSVSLQWTSIDVLRVIHRKKEDRGDGHKVLADTITLFISVGPQAVSWATAMWAARNCKKILEHHGIFDMEVEIKEPIPGQVTDPSQESLLNTRTHRIGLHEHTICKSEDLDCDEILGDGRMTHLKAMMSEVIGSSLVPKSGSHGYGSKTLYLRVQGDGEDYHAVLRSRRVVMGSDDFGAEYRSPTEMVLPRQHHDALPPRKLHVNQVAVEHFRQAEEEFEYWPKLVQDLEKEREKIKNPGVLEGPRGLDQIIASYKEVAEGCFGFTWRLDGRPEYIDRRIGHVIFAAKMDASKGWMRDYALIKLDQRQHEETLANRALIKPWEVMRAVRKNAGFNAGLMPDLIGGAVASITLKDPLTEEEIVNPNNVQAPKVTQDLGLLVSTYGAKSGTAVGIINGVKSITRRHLAGCTAQSWEICVIGTGRNDKESDISFSKPGDAGACVWTPDGRIVGMVTSGAMTAGNRQGGFVTTYVTPMDNILGDLKEAGFSVSLDLPLQVKKVWTPAGMTTVRVGKK